MQPQPNPLPLFDASGRALSLGAELGRGGEGSVCALAGRDDLVAKLYHQPPGAEKAAKIVAMAKLGSERLLKLAAWPTSAIHRGGRGGPVVGFLMPRIAGHKPAFNLYSPKLRLQEFPSAGWGFLIHAAANAARAFAVIHDGGHVIGDVNHGNLVVAPDATVKLIDCDSFQVSAGKQRWFCDVGVSTHQPPEFQSLTSYKGVARTPNHDNFGLAVIVFQLLFMARHPFSGRYLGAGDMPIERAIRDYRFAYGANAHKLQMKPPPGSLGLDGVTRTMAQLFERAFAPQGSREGARPKPEEWIAALGELARGLRKCAANPAHEYLASAGKCPWCEIEAIGGFVLFPVAFLANPGALPSSIDIAALWQEMRAVPDPGAAPALPPPAALRLTKAKAAAPAAPPRRLGWLRRRSAIALAVTTLAIVPAAKLVGPLARVSDAIFWPAAVMILILLCRAAMPRAKKPPTKAELEQASRKARERWSAIEQQWKIEAGNEAFVQRRLALEKLKADYDRLPHERLRRLQDLETNRDGAQLMVFLDRCPLDGAPIKGLGDAKIAVLQSYGIATAADIVDHKVLAVPGVGPVNLKRLKAWRQKQEARFKFDPKKGVSAADKATIEQRLLMERARLERLLTEGVAALAAFSKEIRARRQALGQEARGAAEALLAADAALRGSA
jgi:DNA-binding helix-hairpin-helix protein with protein kinase domain